MLTIKCCFDSYQMYLCLLSNVSLTAIKDNFKHKYGAKFCNIHAPLLHKEYTTLPYPNNIYHMAACTYEVRTLRDGLLIFYEKGEGFVAHTVKAGTHVIGSTIR